MEPKKTNFKFKEETAVALDEETERSIQEKKSRQAATYKSNKVEKGKFVASQESFARKKRASASLSDYFDDSLDDDPPKRAPKTRRVGSNDDQVRPQSIKVNSSSLSSSSSFSSSGVKDIGPVLEDARSIIKSIAESINSSSSSQEAQRQSRPHTKEDKDHEIRCLELQLEIAKAKHQ